MWLLNHWIPLSKELLYGIGFLLFLIAIVAVVIIIRKKKGNKSEFPTSRAFKGKNLERLSKIGKKDLDVNYDDMPIVGLKWQDPETESSNVDYDDDDEEREIDDGYTVVEKAIQEKIQKLQTTPSLPSSGKKASTKKEIKEIKQDKTSVKKDAIGDKMDFFTTGKSAL